VLRGLGRTRTLPIRAAAAIFREGVLLSTRTSRKDSRINKPVI